MNEENPQFLNDYPNGDKTTWQFTWSIELLGPQGWQERNWVAADLINDRLNALLRSDPVILSILTEHDVKVLGGGLST